MAITSMQGDWYERRNLEGYRPWRWLETTRRLQEEYFGTDFERMTDDEKADYFTYNVAALVAELGEFQAEVGWKPWAEPRGWVNRDQAIGELVDVGHFLANLLCALGVTDLEWENKYKAKQQVNRERQASGTYDARSTKCECGRALDEPSSEPFRYGGPDSDAPDYATCTCGRINTIP